MIFKDRSSFDKVYNLTFRDIQQLDTNTWIDLDEYGEKVRINNQIITVVFSSNEVYELKQQGLDLPQSNVLIFYCRKIDFNIKGVNKLILNGTPYNILDISEVGKLYKITISTTL